MSEYLTINSGAEAFNEGGGDVNVAEYGKLNCAEKEKNISRKPQGTTPRDKKIKVPADDDSPRRRQKPKRVGLIHMFLILLLSLADEKNYFIPETPAPMWTLLAEIVRQKFDIYFVQAQRQVFYINTRSGVHLLFRSYDHTTLECNAVIE